MAIDLECERVLPLAEAAEALPALRGKKKVHVSTLYRWISRGVSGVRLEALKLGRTVVTSKEALQRFAENLSRDPGSTPSASNEAEGRAAVAERELERRGF